MTGVCTGLTNAFFMRPRAVMVQLFPYGWQLENGDIIRTGLSRDMPLALNGSYFQVCPCPLFASQLPGCSRHRGTWCLTTTGTEGGPAAAGRPRLLSG